MLAIEIEFALYQANKVKAFVKLTKDKNLDRDTNITAYYLVVGEIFSQLESFLMNCGIDPYLRDHESFLAYLYHLDLPKRRKVSKSDKYYNTLRMSVCELNI